MFKKAKRKIVISILAILCTVLIGTLGMIYIASYISVTAQNYEVLEKRVEMMEEGKSFDLKAAPPPKSDASARPFDTLHGQGRIKRGLEIGTFYAVKQTADGQWRVIDNGTKTVYTDDELISLARGVSEKGKGSTGELLYIVRHTNGETVVHFMDNTVFTESFTRLFLFTLLFGVIAILAIALISVYLANRIVSPMEDTYYRQKQFTADAGHELKTPIAAVAANIEILGREIGENKWLANIAYENERMRDLVTDLLELAKNENKTAERKPTDISRLVNGAILPLEAAAFEKNILIESNIADGISANIDEKGIAQLITILIDNAIFHTDRPAGESGTVTVRLAEKKGAAILSVSNPGEEIPERERKQLFERFYRADTAHEHTGHYGLGLAIAKAIADANGVGLSMDCQNGLVIFTLVFGNGK